jgi:hypothetical protein
MPESKTTNEPTNDELLSIIGSALEMSATKPMLAIAEGWTHRGRIALALLKRNLAVEKGAP